MKDIKTIKGYFSMIKYLANNPVMGLKGYDDLSDELRDTLTDADGYINELASEIKESEKEISKREKRK